LHERLGKNRVNDICQRMRQLARLVKEVNRIRNSEADSSTSVAQLDLNSCIGRSHYDQVVDATKRLCGHFDDPCGRPLFSNPSLGLKLGHNLVKCAEIKRGIGLRLNDLHMIQESKAFISLHKSDWTNRVSSASLATFKHRKYNTPDVLPLTSDLIKLKSYQDKEINSLTSELENVPNAHVWRRLSEVIYTRIVIFNKRRCGETAKLLVKSYTERPRWEAVANDQLVNALQPLEQKLLQRLTFFCCFSYCYQYAIMNMALFYYWIICVLSFVASLLCRLEKNTTL